MEGASFFYVVMGSFFIVRKRIQDPCGTAGPPQPLRQGSNPLGGARILHEQCSQNVS